MQISEVNNKINALPQNLKLENATDLAARIDLNEARRFLCFLDSDSIKFCFQTFSDRKPKCGPDPLARIMNGSFEALKDDLIEMNQRGAGIFVTVNETDGNGRSIPNIRRIRAVFRELDIPAEGAGMIGLEPSIIVESSPGKTHEYFLCAPADPLDHADFEGVQRFLVDVAGSDKNARDLARVLRLPGFFHCKGEPVRVQLLGGNGRRYIKSEITAAFPPINLGNASAAPIDGDLEYTPANEALVRSIIAAIPGDNVESRDDWLRFGFALARLGDDWETEDYTDLRPQLWHVLASKAPSWQIETGCEFKWDEIQRDANRKGRKATIRTLASVARKAGWSFEASDIAPEFREDAGRSYGILMGFLPSPEEIERRLAQLDEILIGVDPALFVEFEPDPPAYASDPVSEVKQVEKTAHAGLFPLIMNSEVAEFCRKETPAVIEGYLDAIGTTLLFGDSQTWKTFGVVDMFDRIAAGESWAGRKTQKGLCAIIAAESPNDVVKRVNAARISRQRGDDHPLVIIPAAPNLFTTRDGDPGDVQRIIRTLREAETKLNLPTKAIAIDTFSKAATGCDSNSDADVSLIEARCDAIARILQCQVILIHHTGKDLGRGPRGSAAFGDNFPTMLNFAREVGPNGEDMRVILNDKQKSREPQSKLILSLRSVEIGENSAGEMMTMGLAETRQEGAEIGLAELSPEGKLLSVLAREKLESQALIANAMNVSKSRVGQLAREAMARKNVVLKDGVYTITSSGKRRLEALVKLAQVDFEWPEFSE